MLWYPRWPHGRTHGSGYSDDIYSLDDLQHKIDIECWQLYADVLSNVIAWSQNIDYYSMELNGTHMEQLVLQFWEWNCFLKNCIIISNQVSSLLYLLNL